MIQQSYGAFAPDRHAEREVAAEQSRWQWGRYPLLLFFALAVDILTPFLIWKNMLPSATRWLSDAAILVMLLWMLARMFAFNRFPLAFPFALALALIGATTAVLEGQAALATVWGLWVMFRYPLLGLFTYLQPTYGDKFAAQIKWACMALLGFQVFVQLMQFATGEIAGDDLAGTFGYRGVGQLSNLLFFITCVALGHWLAKRDLRLLVWVAALGVVASSLGAIKFFTAALTILTLISLIIYLMRGGRLSHLFIPLVLLALAGAIYLTFYNTVVADVRDDSRPFENYLNLDTALNNFTLLEFDTRTGRYQFGRLFALTYGWQLIQRDTPTLLFGMGVGARNESRSLGIIGSGLLEDHYGVTSSTSILVLMQEIGLFGLTMFALFIGWVVVALWRAARADPHSDLAVLCYALILFSLCWPIWLWYHQIWVFSVTMMLYWGTMGYVFNQIHSRQSAQREAAR